MNIIKYLSFLCIVLGISVNAYADPAERTATGAIARGGDVMWVNNGSIDKCNFNLQIVNDYKGNGYWCILK